MAKDVIRRCIFRPYRKGHGPTFRLTVWDTHRRHARGTSLLGYTLHMSTSAERTLLFEGEDFSPSPMDCDDSDACMRAIMGFLTLQPGDTDSEYFDGYTPAQLAFCSEHAESLDSEIRHRFGED